MGTSESSDDPLNPTERQQRARKVKPQLGEGPLMRVVSAANQVEAEFLQGMLLEEGVPSTTRRAAGFDVPDFLAGGPRDVLVAASGFEVAREVLLQADIEPASARAGMPGSGRLAAGLLAALVVVLGVVWAVAELVG
jgi:hypothetical protein